MFWGGYFILNFIRWGSYFNDYWYSIKSNLVEFPLHIIIVYFNIYYLFPNFILKKKYYTFFLYFIFSLILLYFVRTGFNYLLVSKNIWPEAEGIQEAFTFNHVLAVVLGEIYVIAFASTIKLMLDWMYEKNRVDNLQAMQLKTELQFLKAQIQPHFFFNTLNNLYALTLTDNKQASDVVLKLSEIMEYILYDAKEPKIRLLKEIKHIQNYIDLEKLRYDDKLIVEFTMQGAISNQKVPPLLFLPFIENCFKHGSKENENLEILIEFELTPNNLLRFSVANNYNPTVKQTKKHGIGNKNIERRLELLFKNKYTLSKVKKDDKYIVDLTIQL
ncbi:histidine kinase [Polaribacter haliotis]|uniref:Histidine kinase n=1 Tax=Polaribacter haliotis TaxID=1888915 RepID=A0A7L8AKE5_9FLAO|nr:histidine kinase [Polaribacter haliotis]